MRFKFILMMMIFLFAQTAASANRNYIGGPWRYDGFQYEYAAPGSYNHSTEQSAISAALAIVDGDVRTCSPSYVTNPYPWQDLASSGGQATIKSRTYQGKRGQWNFGNQACLPDTLFSDIKVNGYRETACPSGSNPVTGYCSTPANVLIPDIADHPKNCSTCNQTNPIDGATGYKLQTEHDYASSSSPLSFDRFYISATHRAPSLLGNNWRHTYDRALSYVDNVAYSLTTVVLDRPGSGHQFFTLTGGVWTPDAGFTERLEHNVGGGWVYTDNNDTKERYSEEGVLLSIEDRNGRVLTMQYQTDQLTAVVDDEGRSLTFAYQYFPSIPTGSGGTERQDRLTTVGLPDGQLIKFQYDANGMLERVIYPDATPANTADNPYRRYEYGNGTSATTYQLTGLFDERGIQYASWQYNAAGLAISSEHGVPGSGIDKVSLVFNTDGSSLVTNPYNVSRTYTFALINGAKKVTSMSAPCPACGLNFAARTYDSNGEVDIETDFAGTTTDKDYNARGLLIQRIESANQAATKRTTQTDWDATFNVPTERRVLNASNVLEAKTKYAYNARG